MSQIPKPTEIAVSTTSPNLTINPVPASAISNVLRQPKIKPNVYFQLGSPYTFTKFKLFEQEIFDYDVAIPYLPWFMDTAPMNPELKAKDMASLIKVAADEWHRVRPGREFKWAFWPGGFGRGLPDEGIAPSFKDPADMVNGQPSLFSANGRKKLRDWSIRFFHSFKAWLIIFGIPDPVYMDPDYEDGYGNALVDSNPSNSLALYKADPRYGTELIDGRQTLKYYVEHATDLLGNRIQEAKLFQPTYGAGPEHAASAGFSMSLSFMTGDYFLWDTLYQPAKMVFPKLKCGNYNLFTASPQYPTYVYRQKETPYLFNKMYADISVISEYGTNLWEANSSSPTADWGYRTRDELLKRYKINPNSYGTQPDLYRALWLADLDANMHNSVKSSGKESAIWISFEQSVIFSNLNLTAEQWPPNGVQLAYDDKLIASELQLAAKNGIGHIGVFDPDEFIQNISQATIDKMLSTWSRALSQLGNLGYIPATKTPRKV